MRKYLRWNYKTIRNEDEKVILNGISPEKVQNSEIFYVK